MPEIPYEAIVEELGRENAHEAHVVLRAPHLAARGLQHEMRDSRRVEQFAGANSFRRKEVLDIVSPGTRRAEEAVRIRGTIGLLGPGTNVLWNHAARRPLEHVFLVENLHLEARGHRGGKFHDTVVQKRKAGLHRVGHRHPIAL
jgi:hypothetical protein